jgi:glycosyltransferase involved in cell wall biosynthesis
MRIRYLSYGISKTGGYRHEKGLFNALKAYLETKGVVSAEELRRNRLFKGPLAWIDLQIWAYRQSNADINIVTARTSLAAILRNYKSGKQVWVVLHNHDDTDGKPRRLKWYYSTLFRVLRKRKEPAFKIICVAPYWQKYFSVNCQLPHVYTFPNLFDTGFYKEFKTNHKNAWVHLGQYSSKNDPAIFSLARQLGMKGYYCYFSTLDPSEATQGRSGFEVLYFMDFKDYLEHMSRSCCTLALSRVNEGWNRIAHESILVGTPVVGYNKGGLGDLLKESNSVVVNSIDEAYTCITESLWVLPEASFDEKYDIKNASKFIDPICRN